ncbi:DUF2000 domain-containing protein [Streptomyces niveus]|uniref:DUF2000 domain-containing protein n=1 Tax=Streptomyces TaxID=1883 RepID=UPI0010719D5A|nr:DUF2000 domain-containing protein [Streptomyces sp. 4R-3d]TFI25230.1 DUF2000 domain-containing protein [Streptomyces sp. 4R-3d]
MTAHNDIAQHDIPRTGLSTREAPLKWVVVIDADLPAGRAVNAAACMAAAVGKALPGLLGDDGRDASGHLHPGLPWAGCSVLAADTATLHALREKAAAKEDVFVADMPEPAQTSRIYDEYLGLLAGTKHEDLTYHAVALVGPRNRISKLVGKLPLLR